MTDLSVQNAPAPAAADVVARRGVIGRLLRNPFGLVSLIVLALVILAGILAPLLTAWDPNAADVANVLAPPSAEHLLGTDSAGRDVFSRLLYGVRVTFLGALVATGVAVLIGVPAGLLAGFYGSVFDGVSSWIANMLMSLPAFVILLAARAVVGPNVWITMAIFGVIIAPSFYRVTRTSVRAVRDNLYVDAARVSGLGDARIIGRHVFSAVRAPMIIQTALILGISIVIGAAIEFLGLGNPGEPSWGAMVSEGFRNVYISPLFLLWPALAITVSTACFALLGNALRDALEDADVVGSGRGARQSGVRPSSASPTSDALLSVRGLRVSYPTADGADRVVVDDVSFDVGRGEIVGVVGESGSGKTQTAFAVLGLLPDTARIASGSITLEGMPLLDASGRSLLNNTRSDVRGRRIAYVPQEPMSNLDPNYTIGYQLVRPLRKLLGMSKAEAHERALSLLTTVGIHDPEGVMRSYPHEISGGMAQRVLIAGAVSCEPDLLIADEPTTALDVTVQAEVLDLLRDLQERIGMGVLIVTHNFGVVADLCDRVVVMARSRIVEQGPTKEITRHPSEAYTRGLLEATLQGKTPRTPLLRDLVEA